MKLVKEVEGFAIYKRRDGRFAVETTKGAAVNGEEKVAVLLAAELIKVTAAKPVEEAPAEDAPAEEAAAE
ncbi:MAG: hypothetical protein KAG18_05910 [Sinobacterium sp.]|nr:hypothetical protein [Sinobacterium sp.]